MPPIKRTPSREAIRPTKEVVAQKEDEEEEDDIEDEIEDNDDDILEEEAAAQEAEDEEDEEAEDEEGDSEFAGLPDVTEPLGEPGVGFDYFGTVHADLKAAGYVNNQTETKDLLKYLAQMAFFNAFENSKHDIPGLGSVVSDVQASKVKIANFAMKNGTQKGEEYTVPAKHVLGFKVSGAAQTKLAEISEIEGWEPEAFLNNEEEEAEDEE
jgi:hypothetical protein